MCVQLRMQCDEQLLNMADSLVKIVTPSIAVSGAVTKDSRDTQ